MKTMRKIPIGVSARHVHVSKEHLELLFGSGHKLTAIKELSQPGQFAADERVTLVGPKGIIQRVRILGPIRKATQVEISKTDCYTLGIDAPVRESGNIKGSPGIVIVGPYGPVKIEHGVIVAKRHIHFTPKDAGEFGVSDGDTLVVKVEGERPLIFGDVVARIRDDFSLDFHIDTDEANAAGIGHGDMATILDKE